MMLELLIIDIIIVTIYGIALIVMLITKASSDEIITATAIYCIVATIVNGIVYLYPQINYFYNFNNICYVFNKTFTDELSSIKSAFQSTHDKTASLIERMNTEITSKENSIKELQYEIKETFEYLVNDPNNFCSVHDALEMDTSMPCPCWEGSKVPVNEKGEEESIPWGNSEVSITDIGNIVKIDKDTLLKLIKNSEKLSTLEEWGVDNWINYGEAIQYLDDSPDEVLLKQYLDD